VIFIECNRCEEGKIEGLVLPVECCQGNFSGCPFLGSGVIGVLCYGVEKVVVILVSLI
jgi:hypothetical protein